MDRGRTVETPGLGQVDGREATVGTLLLEAAARAGYQGHAARAYLLGRLGQPVPDLLLGEAPPPDWTACEQVAARHGVRAVLLWDLLTEDRSEG
jgi:hypothetical protein